MRTGKTNRPTTGPIPTGDLAGRLDSFSLFDVFEFLSNGRRSGSLKVTAALSEGRCILNRGSLVSASMARLSDAEAVIEMLSTKQGTFSFALAPATDDEAGLDLTALMMETARLEDEFERNAAHFPDETT